MLWQYHEEVLKDGQKIELPWNAEHVQLFQIHTHDSGFYRILCWMEPVTTQKLKPTIPTLEEVMKEVEEYEANGGIV